MVYGHVQNPVVRVKSPNTWTTPVLDTVNKHCCLLELFFSLCYMSFDGLSIVVVLNVLESKFQWG